MPRSRIRAAQMSALFSSTLSGKHDAVSAIFAAMATTPPPALKAAINTFVTSLKTAGVWDLLDRLYVPAVQDVNSALLDWKHPGANKLVQNQSVNSQGMFTPYRGFQGDGVAYKITTGFTPSSQAVNYKVGDSSFWIWRTTKWTSPSTIMGSSSVVNAIILDTNMSVAINQAVAANAAGAIAAAPGFYGVQRTSSTAVKAFVNGAQQASISQIWSTLSAQAQALLSNGASIFNANEVSIAAFGAGLAGLEAAFYNACNAYMTAVLDTSTWIAGKAELALLNQFTVSIGTDVLNFEYTQPWTSIGAVKQFRKPISASVISSNATTSTHFPGIDYLFIDNNGFPHVRVINDILAHYVGVAGTVNVCDGLYHVIAATYDGSGLASGVKIYVDGVQQTTTVESNTLAGLSVVSSPQTVNVGNQANHLDFAVQGRLAFFSLATVVRSQAYIAAVTPATPEAVDANHALFLNFTEGSGTTTTDTSTAARTGTLTDAVMWRP